MPQTIRDTLTGLCNTDKNRVTRAIFYLIQVMLRSRIQEMYGVGDGVVFSWCGYFVMVRGYILMEVKWYTLIYTSEWKKSWHTNNKRDSHKTVLTAGLQIDTSRLVRVEENFIKTFCNHGLKIKIYCGDKFKNLHV